MENTLNLIEILKLTGDSTRLRILHCLKENELAVSEMVEILDMNQSAVSNQLSLMKKSGMVKNRKEGKRIFYSLNPHLKRGDFKDLYKQIFEQAQEQELIKQDQEILEEILKRRREESLNRFRNRKIKDRSCPGESWEATARGFAQLIQNQKIADLGCGSGRLAAILAEGNNQVTGFDNNEEQLEQAKQWEKEFKGNLQFRNCNLEEQSTWDEEYDLAILSHTLHHLSHPSRVLKNIAAMLKPDKGQLLIFDLAAHTEDIFHDMFGDFWLGFEENDLRDWLVEAGFDQIRIKHLPSKSKELNVKSLIVSAIRMH